MGERTTALFEAVGVLSQPPEQRSECRDRVVNTESAFPNAHEHHACFKVQPHEVHRCWTCTHTWRT